MSIDKKSLISNRIANKKAIVTKPEGSKIASNKTAMPKVTGMSHTRVAGFKPGLNKIKLH